MQSETVKRLRHKTRQINAEQFIEGAINYANGQTDNVIALHANKVESKVETKVENKVKSEVESKVENKTPFRRATFTLSEPCIDLLSKQANQQQCAKSHLIRMLIRHFDELPAHQQQAILAQQKD